MNIIKLFILLCCIESINHITYALEHNTDFVHSAYIHDIRHLDHILSEFQQTQDQIAFEYHTQKLYEYYILHYEHDVQNICTHAYNYFSTRQANQKSIIIFDIDDTSIYTYQWHEPAEFIWSQQPFLLESKVNGRNRQAPAIRPVHELYHKLKEKGFTIIFLSARPQKLYDVTKQELINAGYTDITDIILMPDVELNFEKVAIWKAHIRKQLAQEYIIIGCIGDRSTDFEGGHTGYEVRLPNYLY